MECIDRFLEFEQKHSLLDKKLDGFDYWIYVRFNIYSEIEKQLLGFENISPKLSGKGKTLDSVVKEVLTAVKRSPMHKHKKCDIIFVNHERRMRLDGEDVPIYFDEIIKKYKGDYIILEPKNIFNSHYQNERYAENTYYLDYIVNVRAAIHRRLTSFEDKEFEKDFRLILSKLEEEFNVVFDKNKLIRFVYQTKISYEINKKNYKKMLKRLKPKKIVEVVYYNNLFMALNEAAKEMNIPVFELQHGLMGNSHIAYNFSEKRDIKCFPDKIMVFGEYWRRVTRFPIDDKNIIPVGYPYIEYMKKIYGQAKTHTNNILFISQKTIGKELSRLAVSVAKKIKEENMPYKVIYKLHPSEVPDWKEALTELYCCRDIIEVASDSSESIYKYFSEAVIQVGVYSTAIYEGMAFGLKTFIYNTEGCKYVRDLYEMKYATLINNENDLFDNLEAVTEERNDFWEDDAVENIILQIN